jgi:hypothetical protein
MYGVSRSIRWLIIIFALALGLRADVKAVTFQLNVSKEHYRSELVGDWNVDTQVTWSDCPYVKVGQGAVSELNVADVNGSLYPTWKANEWELVKNSAINISNDDQIVWERSNKLYKDGKYWYVESVDRFNFDKNGKLKAKSLVKQFLDGEYVGSYITESVLDKPAQVLTYGH